MIPDHAAFNKLHSILYRLLKTDEHQYGELYKAADDLYLFLAALTDISYTEIKNHHNLFLDSGKAISVTWAAFCIKEFMRTRKFMQAVLDATGEAVQKAGGQPVHILYAGTGPFATLILPLTALYTSQQVQFTLLEINDDSFNSVQRLLHQLQLNDYIHQLVKTDATTWQLPTGEQPAIFISETMQRGLKTEPQVAIFQAIIPQLPAGTFIIPQQVTITAVMTNELKRRHYKLGKITEADFYYPLGEVFVLNKETVMQKIAMQSAENPLYPACTLALPTDIPGDNNLLELHTHITIGHGHCLVTEEVPLTMPLTLTRFNDGLPSAIRFQYEMGKMPGIRYQSVASGG